MGFHWGGEYIKYKTEKCYSIMNTVLNQNSPHRFRIQGVKGGGDTTSVTNGHRTYGGTKNRVSNVG